MPRRSSFSKLVADVRACTLCASELPRGPRPLLQLDPRARILIAGQAPGRRAHESGVPFDDPSGDRLRAWLGVNRASFYDAQRIAIVPMGFCYPGSGRSGDLPPRPECAVRWREPVLDALRHTELTLAIGRHAILFHLGTGARSVTETVRAWRAHWPALLPLPHPSPRNNGWLERNPWFVDEVLPALRARVELLLR